MVTSRFVTFSLFVCGWISTRTQALIFSFHNILTMSVRQTFNSTIHIFFHVAPEPVLPEPLPVLPPDNEAGSTSGVSTVNSGFQVCVCPFCFAGTCRLLTSLGVIYICDPMELVDTYSKVGIYVYWRRVSGEKNANVEFLSLRGCFGDNVNFIGLRPFKQKRFLLLITKHWFT